MVLLMDLFGMNLELRRPSLICGAAGQFQGCVCPKHCFVQQALHLPSLPAGSKSERKALNHTFGAFQD